MTRRNCRKRNRLRIMIGVLLTLLTSSCCITAAYAKVLPEEFLSAFGSEEFTLNDNLNFTKVGVLETDTQSFLYSQNVETPFTPTGGAVTVMTAYIALCEVDINADVEITEDMLLGVTGSIRAGLRVGDVVKIKDLVASMIMTGAQDCAEVLAVHLAGSQEAFVKKMNEYATELGMDSTSYTNATGSYNANQKTTIGDLLRLSVSLNSLDVGNELFSSAQLTTESPNSHLANEIDNRVMLINPDRSLYDKRIQAAFGAGISDEEGFNTIVLAKIDDMELIVCCCAKLSDRGTYKNISLLLDDIGRNFRKLDIKESVQALFVDAHTDDGVGLNVQIDEPIMISALNTWNFADHDLRYELSEITAEAKINEYYATATVFIEDKKVAWIPLICSSLPEKQQNEPEAPNTPDSAPEPSTNGNSGKYTAEDEQYVKTAYDQWGWAYWIAGSTVVCTLIALLCGLIERRIK